MTSRSPRLLAAVLCSVIAAVSAFGESKGDEIGTPLYTVHPLRSESLITSRATYASMVTVPTWRSQFQYKSDNGAVRTYNYTMVGTNPSSGSATTTVATAIIPIALIFSSGTTLDGGSRVADTVASPVFQPFASQTGFTQYADAVQRASFFNVVQAGSPEWHVLLGQPEILPTINMTVPAEAGFAFTGSTSKATIGLVDSEWFSKQVHLILAGLDLDPRSLPIFLTHNSFLFLENPAKCCIVGFHSALASAGPGNSLNVNTFVWASYADPMIFGNELQDITALSHEVAEWYSDPLMSNRVPSWAQPGSSTCSSRLLEVGDPIQGLPNLSFRVLMNGREYHPQDVALFSWFTRQAPSLGLRGRYSYRGDKFAAPAANCQTPF